jgi:hypothetical protein
MITPILEKLILCGKASFNTFVAGASEKSILFVDNDRFIIITGLTYFPSVNNNGCLDLDEVEMQGILDRNTQVKIFSEKSLNNFIFRNELNVSEVRVTATQRSYTVTPGAPIKLDTFLIHDNSVSFTFSYALSVIDAARGITKAQSVAYPLPIDYGKEGQNALPVRTIGSTVDAVTPVNIYSGGPFSNDGTRNGFNEFVYPVDAFTQIKTTHLNKAANYPLLLVDYVEIIGNPTNISATL